MIHFKRYKLCFAFHIVFYPDYDKTNFIDFYFILFFIKSFHLRMIYIISNSNKRYLLKLGDVSIQMFRAEIQPSILARASTGAVKRPMIARGGGKVKGSGG